MSKTTPEEAKALMKKHCASWSHCDMTGLAALIDEVVANAPLRGVDAEPVAWINAEDLVRMRMAGRGGIVWPHEQKGAETALYTHPAPLQSAAPVDLPDCSSDAANVAIDKELALRNYPANSANAGRAGWEAARKFKLSQAQAAIAAGRKAA